MQEIQVEIEFIFQKSIPAYWLCVPPSAMMKLWREAVEMSEGGIIMWACYLGEISESYRENWTPHTVSPDQKEPDVFDVLSSSREIMYRLDWTAAAKCFSDKIQVDWGGWAYKVTKGQAMAYNDKTGEGNWSIPQSAIDEMEDGKVYGIINVELY